MNAYDSLGDYLSDLISWNKVKNSVQSPLFKTVSIVPIVGYLIIYGDQFQNWFDLSVIGEDLWLTGEARLRLLYYGGVCMVLAMIGQFLFCPLIIKQFSDVSKYVEHVHHNFRPTNIARAIWEISQFGRTARGSAAIESEAREAIEIIVGHANHKTHLLSGVSNKGLYNVDSGLLRSAFEQFGQSWSISANRLEFRNSCDRILALHYRLMNSHVRVAQRNFTLLLAVLGIGLVAIPAIETFIRILLIDLSA